MHDDALERRLSEALHDEAASLPFTITPAELERRLALRRRGLAGRRLTLLLAAAVGVGLFGVGGALSGLFDQKQPTPTTPAVVDLRSPDPSTAGEKPALPSLDQLVLTTSQNVLVAQAHGPADRPAPTGSSVELPPPSIGLGTFEAGHQYAVSVGCLSKAPVQVDIRVPFSRGPISGPTLGCDGVMHEQLFDRKQPQAVSLQFGGAASWRVMVQTPDPSTGPFVADPIIPLPAGQEQLARWDDAPVDSGGQPWHETGLITQQIGALPGREGYNVTSRCAAASPIRLILGDVVQGVIEATTETQLACEDQVVRDMSLGIAEPDGSQVFLAAAPDQRASILISAATPPVALTQQVPGWQLSGGLGPEYAFETHGMSFGGAGVGEDHIQVVMACTGTKPIEVFVEDAVTQTFEATCSPEGNTTVQTFRVTEQGVGVRYVAPKGTWTALSILVPSN